MRAKKSILKNGTKNSASDFDSIPSYKNSRQNIPESKLKMMPKKDLGGDTQELGFSEFDRVNNLPEFSPFKIELLVPKNYYEDTDKNKVLEKLRMERIMKEKAKKLKRLIFKPREAAVIDSSVSLEVDFATQCHNCPLFEAMIQQEEKKKREAPKVIKRSSTAAELEKIINRLNDKKYLKRIDVLPFESLRPLHFEPEMFLQYL